ncbi:MAG: DUF192 domain-containing protein [Chromatiales bacterium]|nr:DUF192 domain-containing protein [Chromatiales bacterium]MDX9767379.1 DUF192 domain-containing protein [Ectothiorhodospiraceae bacterium]
MTQAHSRPDTIPFRLALLLATLFLAFAASVVFLQRPAWAWERVNRYLPLPTVELRLGEHPFTAEVATGSARARGLMHRREMPENHGMIFVYDQPRRLVMWMKNTYLPLSVAFLDTDGRIINIADMQPLTETRHASHGPAQYALEMHQGWFAARNIGPGDSVDLTGLK